MSDRDEDLAGKTKAALIDPATMQVVWVNEAAEASAGRVPGADGDSVPLEFAIPLPKDSGAEEALAATASDGEPRKVHAKLISSGRGTLLIVTSIYRLPDGMLLALTENTFQVPERSNSAERRPGRRR